MHYGSQHLLMENMLLISMKAIHSIKKYMDLI